MNKNKALVINARQIACSNPFQRLAEQSFRQGEQIYMRVKMYDLIGEVVEEGIEAGWQYAHKHTDSPTEDTIKHCIEKYIMLGFNETFYFERNE